MTAPFYRPPGPGAVHTWSGDRDSATARACGPGDRSLDVNIHHIQRLVDVSPWRRSGRLGARHILSTGTSPLVMESSLCRESHPGDVSFCMQGHRPCV